MDDNLLTAIRNLFLGDIEVNPLRLTVIQSILVIVLAAILAIGLYQIVGVHYPNVWYQLFAALVIAAILAPIFLYPTFKTSARLRQANAVIKEQAVTDYLTGLPNMHALSIYLDQAFEGMDRSGPFAVHFLDFVRFKQINDSLGHDAGNRLLIAAAEHLRNYVESRGFLARFGGDEFVVIHRSGTGDMDPEVFAEGLRQAVSTKYRIHDREISIGATVGTAIAPIHGEDRAQILAAANMAFREAKSAGFPHRIFEQGMAASARAKRELEGVLKTATAENLLRTYFHSIVRLDNPLHIVGFEALARIERADGGAYFPEAFIPVAEDTGLIVEIGQIILRQACAECVRWGGGIFVAVNVSPIQFIQSDFVQTVQDVLDETGLEPNRLELEITESVLINDIAYLKPALAHLRGMGIRIALDDFGAGYCGLHYLRQFTIDKIKIDKTVMDDAGKTHIASNILKSVAVIADKMDLTLTVEGVDDIAKAELLAKEQFAQELQGFLFSRPVTAEQAFEMQKFMAAGEDSPDPVTLLEFARNKAAG